jgi:hypothetical protein
VVTFLGSAESARLRLDPIDKYSAIVQFNKGPFIEKVDVEKSLRDYCASLKPEIISEKEKQLPG